MDKGDNASKITHYAGFPGESGVNHLHDNFLKKA